MMKLKRLICVLILTCLCIAGPLYAEVVDRIIAVVNGDIISQSQLDKETRQYKKRIELSGDSEIQKRQMIKEVNQKTLESLIDQTLTRQEARKYNISVDDAEVDESIAKIMQDEKIPPEKFKILVRQQGMTYDEYRESIRKQIIQSRVINAAVQSKVAITDADIKKAYQENKELSAPQTHIHLKNILTGDKKRIEKIKKRLDNDGNFEVLARLYSSAPNAKEGGDIGTFNIKIFSEGIQKAIKSVNKGEHSDIIETPQGFQIFYIADIIEKEAQSLEQAREKIYEILYRKRIEEKFKVWLGSLKKSAYIKKLETKN